MDELKNLDLNRTHLTRLPDNLPLKVRNFSCSHNNLTSLINSPIEITDNYICSYNKLTSLEGAPKKVDGNFYCHQNKLTFDQIVFGLLHSEIEGFISSDFNFNFQLFFHTDHRKKISMLFEQELEQGNK